MSSEYFDVECIFLYKKEARRNLEDFVSACETSSKRNPGLPLKQRSEDRAKAMIWIADKLNDLARHYSCLLYTPFDKQNVMSVFKNHIEYFGYIHEWTTADMMYAYFVEASRVIKEACMLIVAMGREAENPTQLLYDWWKEVRNDQIEHNVRYTLKLMFDAYPQDYCRGEAVLFPIRLQYYEVYMQELHEKIDALLGYPPATMTEILKYGASTINFFQNVQYWAHIYPTLFQRGFIKYLVWCVEQYNKPEIQESPKKNDYRFPCYESFREWWDENKDTYYDCIDAEGDVNVAYTRSVAKYGTPNKSVLFAYRNSHSSIDWEHLGQTYTQPVYLVKDDNYKQVSEAQASNDQTKQQTKSRKKRQKKPKCTNCKKKHRGQCRKPPSELKVDGQAPTITQEQLWEIYEMLHKLKINKMEKA